MLHWQYQPYTIPFRFPLHTAHGRWTVREGAIATLWDDSGQRGQGEIAPVPWFGSETLGEAIALLQTLPPQLTPEAIAAIPDRYPATQFALESAWLALQTHPPEIALQPEQIAHLLPTGPAALTTPIPPQTQTVKWKIGLTAVTEEIRWFRQLCTQLPPGVQIRLDANGSLTPDGLARWLEAAQTTGRVELIEQPLKPDCIEDLLTWQARSPLPLALDESVAQIAQLEQWQAWGWRGVYVVKGAIAGFPSRLRQICQGQNLDIIYSSVFETAVGRQNGLQLAQDIHNGDRALGFGTVGWLAD
ncbi:o-succinylbenzoate synthase [Spirulina sp. CCNP1310]|uniref:o-succinylbenzoate synthase n=1 Tax=Spirulina sp. CCNP1310 TaxID=3110249 RepID=UPI002B2078A5|nr:o-succinylbenzoate synthase [Spirulina sp. CCNP1310]MEA5418858.1 o-succinylbenzoate synthase [Spirulina sp. CCNP1310]